MQINVSNIKLEVLKLNKLIDEYENSYLNLYNEMTKASTYWQDNHSINFFSNVDFEKNKASITLEEIKSVRDVYNLLIKKYQSIGNKIRYNPKNLKRLLIIFDTYNDNIDDIIRCYRNLDLSFCSYERRKLNQQRQTLQNTKQILNQIKNNIINIINKIEEIEQEINLKISKINIEAMKENSVSDYI